MLRAIAILLIQIISFGLIAPAMPTGIGTASLPACCREHGKHQCAMKMAQHTRQEAIRSIGEKCPYSSKLWTAVSNSQTFLLYRGPLFFGAVVSHPAVHAQTEARCRISFSRSRQKRGPPSLLFS